MKNLFTLISLLFITRISVQAQQSYCDFEGTKLIHFGMHTGVLDSSLTNPAPNSIDTSAQCGMFIRDTATYNWMRIYTDARMADITPYASNSFNAPKMRMKVYSTAPVGTMVQIQLGISTVDNYPSGIHSIYQAMTTTQNAWEELVFNYYQTIPNSLALPTNIDKMIVLYELNSNNIDTMYFDDIQGPPQINNSTANNYELFPFSLGQSSPNPAKGVTQINFTLKTKGNISLVLYDLIGNPVRTLAEGEMGSGTHFVPFETADMPTGIYFYVLTMNGSTRSMKMIVNR
jgi:hypothetical protein